jgi:hypothetical protein
MRYSINLGPAFRLGLFFFLAAQALRLGFPFQSAIESIILLGGATVRYLINTFLFLFHLGRRISEYNHLGTVL